MKKDVNKDYFNGKKPEWLKMTEQEQEELDTILGEILLFFVFYYSSEEPCSQSRSLQYYGWDKNIRLSKKILKDKLNSQFIDCYCVKTGKTISEMPSVFIESGLQEFPLDSTKERIAIFLNKDNMYESIFYHIRCAFAHGRASLKIIENKRMLFIENIGKKDLEYIVKARMILNYETIKGWINVIKNGPTESKN